MIFWQGQLIHVTSRRSVLRTNEYALWCGWESTESSQLIKKEEVALILP